MNAPSLSGRYESPLLPIPGATSSVSVTHGRGGKPWFVRCVLVAIKAELQYAAEDEIDVINLNGAGPFSTFALVVASAAQLTFVLRGAIQLPNKDGTGFTTLTAANWRLKFYAQW
jgi:hypothetical protein